MFLPAGTATGNDDAVRQGTIAQFFATAGNLLAGTDNAYTMEPGTENNGLLGPTPTVGFDIGVGNNGDLFVRGRTNANDPSTTNSQTQQATVVGSPLMLLLLAVGVFLILK